MSITVHSADTDEAELNTTINTTPLVDVMLVLLIIFLITVPVVIKQIPVTLPNARNIPTITKPENITIAVDKDGDTFWNNAPVDVGQLRPRFVASLNTAIAKGGRAPEVHARGGRVTRIGAVGRVARG